MENAEVLGEDTRGPLAQSLGAKGSFTWEAEQAVQGGGVALLGVLFRAKERHVCA